MIKVYISGVLTNAENLEEVKNFYERIAEVCLQEGLTPYVPHQHSDPVKHPSLTPREVYLRDKSLVLSSDLLIAYVGVPSIGVGMEIAYADEHNVPIILMYEANAHVSRMVRGLPSRVLLKEIAFGNVEEGLALLRRYIREWVIKHTSNPHSEASGGSARIILSDGEEVFMPIEQLLQHATRQKLRAPLHIYVDLWTPRPLQESIAKLWPESQIFYEFVE